VWRRVLTTVLLPVLDAATRNMVPSTPYKSFAHHDVPNESSFGP
jgi:hypothetical protein